MPYVVKAKIKGKMYTGKRMYKTLAGAKKSIKSPSGQAYIKKHKATFVHPVKIKTMKGRHF